MSHRTTDRDEKLLSIMHAKGREYVNHFSSIKLKYKKLALMWLTAICAALAYTISGHDEAVHFSKLYLIALITFLSVVGIKLIRFLDVYVYHRQMRAIFKSLVLLENQCPQWSHPYTNMAKALHKKRFDPIIVDSMYYGSINFCIVFLGATSIYTKLQSQYPILGIYILIAILLLFFVWECIATALSIRHGGSRFG